MKIIRCYVGSALISNFIFSFFLVFTQVGYAAGLYDGIYVNVNSPTNYLSLHQNGSKIILSSQNTVSSNQTTFSIQVGTVVPKRFDIWDLFSGELVGTTAVLSGEIFYGACGADLKLNFTKENEISSELVMRYATVLGTSQAVDCFVLSKIVSTSTIYKKVF